MGRRDCCNPPPPISYPETGAHQGTTGCLGSLVTARGAGETRVSQLSLPMAVTLKGRDVIAHPQGQGLSSPLLLRSHTASSFVTQLFAGQNTTCLKHGREKLSLESSGAPASGMVMVLGGGGEGGRGRGKGEGATQVLPCCDLTTAHVTSAPASVHPPLALLWFLVPFFPGIQASH